MPSPLVNKTIATASRRVPGLRRLPVLKLLALGEVALLAHEHLARLDRTERRRLLHLVRVGRGRRRNLTAQERDELSELIAKTELRQFLGHAVNKLSPLPVPKRIVSGPRKRRRPA